jgi:hypothetical protein
LSLFGSTFGLILPFGRINPLTGLLPVVDGGPGAEQIWSLCGQGMRFAVVFGHIAQTCF